MNIWPVKKKPGKDKKKEVAPEEPKQRKDRCETCGYFEADVDTVTATGEKVKRGDKGTCHRYPPGVQRDSIVVAPNFPRVRVEFWCGGWKA